MVSLLKLAEITEDGVNFESPYDGSKCMLTPERSIEIQQAIGADIMMQLDDVVDATNQDPDRFEEARHRTVRWLDRCLAVHHKPDVQNLFPIVQGGLDHEKRKDCAAQLTARDVPGFAIGGLSGGEEKDTFWRIVKTSAEHLPDDKPRYLMGVGHQVRFFSRNNLSSFETNVPILWKLDGLRRGVMQMFRECFLMQHMKNT